MADVVVINAHHRIRVPKKPIQAYVRRVMGTRRGWVSVVLLDSRRCRAINRRFLQHDFVPDVIAFPLETERTLEGEIYVNLDRAKQQARDYHVRFAEEVARLVIHGALHLLGYDDRTKRSAQRMHRVQERQVRFWFPHDRRNTS
ncbi:MAG: rRNA maturation RNase YbeY [Ignavibacteria bacterium]